jgi:hypothetical protein
LRGIPQMLDDSGHTFTWLIGVAHSTSSSGFAETHCEHDRQTRAMTIRFRHRHPLSCANRSEPASTLRDDSGAGFHGWPQAIP